MAYVEDGWLDAFARAFPLRSQWAFEHGLVELGPDDANQRLEKELEEELRWRSRGLSLEVLRLVRERAWFGEMPSSPRVVPLADHLRRYANEVLEDVGGRCVPRERANGERDGALSYFRWATLALPVDLLIAAAADDVPTQAYVDTLAPELGTLLRDRGVAETHVHQNAAQDFAHLWARAMTGERRKPNGPVSRPPFGGLDELRRWLEIARLARLVLAWALTHGGGRVVGCVKDLVDRATPGEPSWPQEIVGQLRRLLRRDRSPPEALPRFIPSGLERALVEMPNARASSPLASLLGGRDDVEAELRLMYRGMRELTGELALLFWQYVRVRVQTFAWVVQDPGTAGLGWFSEHFARMKFFAKPSSTFAEARELEERGVRLVSLEVRKGWPDDLAECWRVMRDAAACAGDLEVGIVLHFVKDNEAKEVPTHNDATGYRFGDWYRKQLRFLDRLEAAVARQPWLALFVRGFDIANEELRVPTWAVAPLFRRARAIGRAAARRLARDPSLPRADFRATAHAGEEFRSLGEGLRRIDEIVRYGQFRGGDRLGHALALGMDPGAWAARHPVVLQPAEERIQDLLWELQLRRSGHVDGDAGRIAVLEEQIRVLLAADVLPVKLVDEALALREQLFDAYALCRVQYPDRQVRAPLGLEALDEYLSNDRYALRGRAPVRVYLHKRGEVEALHELRQYVWREVAAHALTIEMNISSNLLIGDMGSLDGHPALAFRNPPDGLPPLATSANDDDPLTFATSLPDEYAYCYAQKRGESVGASEALEWIDRLRREALASRFTLNLTARRQLLQKLADYEREPR